MLCTCVNPLEALTSPLMTLLDRLRDSRQVCSNVEELLRQALGATAIGVAVVRPSGAVSLLRRSGDVPEGAFAVLSLLPAASFTEPRAALGYVDQLPRGGPRLLVVPVSSVSREEVTCVIAVEPAAELLALGELAATVVRAVWQTTPGTGAVEAEVEVLTALRNTNGRIPAQVYQRAFAAYQRLMGDMVMVFQPVMRLAPSETTIGIYGWEALARRGESEDRAPFGPLDAARVWGDRFVIERDIILATNAISSYARAHAAAGGGVPKPLSINVAVRSLLSDVYADAVGAAIAQSGLGSGTITLEISEQDPIEPGPGEMWTPNPMEFFRSRLSELAARLHVAFAVDDFGVGHASLDRLAHLALTQIKVDRAILHHELAREEIKLVLAVAASVVQRGAAPAPRTVVLEGVDSKTPLTLKDIYDTGIRYVQGFITETPATGKLTPLSADLQRRVAAQLN